MANQEWITDSNLGDYNEETRLNNIIIKYRPSTNENRKTLNPILLSSNVPSEISLSLNNDNTISVNGILPKVDEDTEYYFTYRLKEVEISNPSNVTNIDDRYFTFTSLNIPVSWNELDSEIETGNNCIFEMNLKKYLNNANGNETFKKVSGKLPEGIVFNEDGSIIGYLEEVITDTTEYIFTVRVYSNGSPIEGLEDKSFTISVNPETMEQKPIWSTEPNLGNINKNEIINSDDTKFKLSAYDLSESNGMLSFVLAKSDDENVIDDPDITGLPPGLSLKSNGIIYGTCTTTQVKDWYFGAYVEKYIEEYDDPIKSDYRKFLISTNKGSAEHEISWVDPTKTYVLGTYAIGEELSLQLPLASAADGSLIKYSFSGNTYPKGLELSDTGLINGKLDLQDIGTYNFEVMAKTDFTYITRKFSMNVKQGLSESALKLYLRINLEYKNEFIEIKNQLNPNTLYNENIDTYNVSNFPKIDVATLKCYDREVLASMMNFGNPEIVRFGLTKSLPYSHIDGNGNLTANYEMLYKSIDENTYQWDEIDNGNYDFQAKLDQLQATDDIDNDTKLEFNNEYYETSVRVWKLLGEVPTYAKLLTCNTSELKPGYYAKVLRDETHNDEVAYYMYYGDTDPATAWDYVGKELPHDVQNPNEPSVNPIVKTTPEDSYQIFNFKNVRDILSQRIYVKNIEGTYYYDEGNQQIVTPTGDINGVKNLSVAIHDMYRAGEQVPFIKKGEYYTTDENGTNETVVDYENHIVTVRETGHIDTNILFKPDFNSPNFIVYEDGGEIYYANEITNPWCYDFSKNDIKIDTVPSGAEMVMPNIKTSDVNFLLGGNPYVVFLDTSIEPLPMWKRKQPKIWKPNTVYKTKEIIIYNSLYYKVKQQFTSGNEFIYDTNLLELISGDVIDAELPKNYFPTLDLGYYQSGTNRKYLKDLNEAEKKGDFWYRKDFLFWELIAEPIYNQNIDTFGIPFYSTQNRMELVNQGREIRRTFEIVCNTPDAVVSIIIDGEDVVNGEESIKEKYEYEHNGNKWKVKFDIGSHISWEVSAGNDYYSEGGDYIIVSDEKHVISLKKKCTVTIIPLNTENEPIEATVTLTAAGYTQEGNSITVREGTYIEYLVEKEDYLSFEGSLIANNTQGINVKLKQYMRLTLEVSYTNETSDESLPLISLNAENAKDITETIVKTHSGNDWVVQKSIKVPEGTYVSYIVSKESLKTKKGNYKVIENGKTLPLTLNDDSYTFTVNPTPADATVEIEAERPLRGGQIGNSIMVAGKPDNEPTSWIKYIVSKAKNETFYETFTEKLDYISSDTTVNITLKQIFKFNITAKNPSDATIEITEITNVKDWEFGKPYGEHSIVKYNDKFYNANKKIEIDANNPNLPPSEDDGWTEIETSGHVIDCWVVDGQTVKYTVKKLGYNNIKEEILIKKDENIEITMTSFGGFCEEDAHKEEEENENRFFVMEKDENIIFQSEKERDY